MAGNPVEMNSAERVQFLTEKGHALQLATNGKNGFPHLAAMSYVYARDRLYFNTYGTSQKARNLERDPRVACMVEAGKEYHEQRGVVIQGTAVRVTDPDEIDEITLALIRRYPLPTGFATPETLFEHVKRTKRVLYRVEPEKTYSWHLGKPLALQPRKG